MNPMKVVHLCNVPLVPDHPDAGRIQAHPGRWVLNLAIAQKKYTAIEPWLVMQVPGSRRNYFTEVEGIPIHYLAAPNHFRSSTFFYFDARRISRHVATWSPQVVHAHGTEDAYALAGLACRRPFVLTVQGCHFLINRELPPVWLSRERLIERTERSALRRTHHVIAKSDYMARELTKAFPHLQLHRIPNTIDERLLEIPIDGPKNSGHIAFVGTVVPRKGFHRIRQAFQLLKEKRPREFGKLHLHVFGNSPSGMASLYEESELAALKTLLLERLHLHGIVPSLDLAAQLARIAVLAAPSLEEMFGNQAIEAMGVGARPIVTEGTAMADHVRAFGFGVTVPQDNVEQLAMGLVQKAFDPAKISEIEAVRGVLGRNLGPSKVAQDHLRVYEQILGVQAQAPDSF
jgi:glycosyltransferase involved in cell wall biosynthesis